ncbi:MAG: histidine phosphatase family protein [Clostridiaceae bacterium]|nr:histidine phosphatase family protein [Eubacteriales bacterium]
MNLFLARHGECDGNALRLFFGRTDYPLTERGLSHADMLREKFASIPVSAVYASRLKRSYETAEIAMRGKTVSFSRLEELNEQDMGPLEGLTYEDAMAQNPDELPKMLGDWTRFSPPGVESFQAVSERVLRALRGIINKGEDALIVSHNGPLSILSAHLLGLDLEKARLFYYEHGAYTLFRIDERGASLRCFNK